jgi:molecular chaperone GrpE
MADSKSKPPAAKAPPGHFEADVSADIIREALESVQRITAPAPVKEIELEIAPPLEFGVEPETVSDAPAFSDLDADEKTDGVGVDIDPAHLGNGVTPEPPVRSLEEVEKELVEVKATLELSAARAKETLDRLKDTHDRQLRAVADLENYKKRAVREREEAEKFAIGKLVKELLSVLDNLDRALEHSAATEGQGGPAEGALATGIQATRRLFEDILGKFGVRGFSAKGQVFDPSRHEAIQQVPTTEVPPGTVAVEIARGYHLNDRLLRPALVGVATAPKAPEPPPLVVGTSGTVGTAEAVEPPAASPAAEAGSSKGGTE